MKSFSVFQCSEFPKMESKTLEDVIRDENLFGGRDIRTSFRLISEDYYGFQYFDVEHSFQYPRPGRAMVLDAGMMKEVKFSEHIEDIVFPAYYNPQEKMMIFAVKKDIAQDVYKNILERPTLKAIGLTEHPVDFELLEPLIGEYKSVWFSGMKSGGLHSASLAGTNLKEHPHFTDYKNSGGKLSFVTIPFVHNDAIHPIGITKESGVILQQKYDNVRTELDLISVVHEKLLKRVWKMQEEKAASRKSA